MPSTQKSNPQSLSARLAGLSVHSTITTWPCLSVTPARVKSLCNIEEHYIQHCLSHTWSRAWPMAGT